MKIFKILGLAALLVAALTGCATNAPANRPLIDERTLEARITQGVTTRADILATFGIATVVAFNSGYEVWIYKDATGAPRFLRYVPVVGLGAGLIADRKRELVILFGPDGVVRKSRFVVEDAKG